jgi:hypothetical protein
MVSAQLYLSVNPFERLSRANNKSIDPSENDNSHQRPSSAPMSNSKKDNNNNSTEHNSSFNKFLERQQQHITKKELDQTVLREVLSAQHTPAICKKSIVLSKKRGSFLERLQQEATHKKSQEATTVDVRYQSLP